MSKYCILFLFIALFTSCGQSAPTHYTFSNPEHGENFNRFFKEATAYVAKNPEEHLASIFTDLDGKLGISLSKTTSRLTPLFRGVDDQVCEEETYDAAANCGKQYAILGRPIIFKECAYCIYVN